MEEEDIHKDELYLKYAILGAEGWAESTRKTIEERLGVKAYDNWGMTEAYGPGPSVECQEQNGLHIWSDYFYPEVIDPDTGNLKQFFSCMVNGKRIELLDSYETKLVDGDAVALFPPVGGG